MGRYKFNNRGTGTIFWLGFYYPVADPGGGWQGWSPPPPPELVPIKTYCKVFVTGPIAPPPLECGWRHTGNVQRGGGGACLRMSKSGGVFQFFGGRMTSRRQCPRARGGGCLWNVFTAPPSGNPVSAPVICVKFRANQPLCPPPPPNQSGLIRLWPYWYVCPLPWLPAHKGSSQNLMMPNKTKLFVGRGGYNLALISFPFRLLLYFWHHSLKINIG